MPKREFIKEQSTANILLDLPADSSRSALEREHSRRTRNDSEAWSAELRLPLKLALCAMMQDDSATTAVVALTMLLAVRDDTHASCRRSDGPVDDIVLDTRDTCERVASTPWLAVRDNLTHFLE